MKKRSDNENGGIPVKGTRALAFRVIIPVVCAAVFIVLSLVFDFHFDTNDDTAIRDILSGSYTGTPNGRCIQLLYPLGAIIAGLYRTVPKLPWFSLVLMAFQWLSLWMLSDSIVFVLGSYVSSGPLKTGEQGEGEPASGKEKGRLDKRIILLSLAVPLFIVLLYFREMVFYQYTFTAGMMMAAAIAWALSKGADSSVILMALLSFNLRRDMMLLLLPFLIFAIIKDIGLKSPKNLKSPKGLKNPKSHDGLTGFKYAKVAKGLNSPELRGYFVTYKRSLLLPLTLIILMVLCLGADYLAYSGENWKEFKQVFDGRTRLYDYYGIPSYDDNKEIYDELNLTYGDYELLENYNIDISDRIDGASLTGLSEYAGENNPKSSQRRLYEAAYAYIYRFTHGEELVYDILAVILYIALFKSRAYIYSLLMLVMRTGLWMFLLYRGRVPVRITHPLYMTELSILLVLLALNIIKVQSADTTGIKENCTSPCADTTGTKGGSTTFCGAGGSLGSKRAGAILRRALTLNSGTFLLLFATVIICGGLLNINRFVKEYDISIAKNKEWEGITDYCLKSPDTAFYFDVYSTVAYREKMFGRVSFHPANYDLCGGWRVKSPLSVERAGALGIDYEDRYKSFTFIYNPEITKEPWPGELNIEMLEITEKAPFVTASCKSR